MRSRLNSLTSAPANCFGDSLLYGRRRRGARAKAARWAGRARRRWTIIVAVVMPIGVVRRLWELEDGDVQRFEVDTSDNRNHLSLEASGLGKRVPPPDRNVTSCIKRLLPTSRRLSLPRSRNFPSIS